MRRLQVHGMPSILWKKLFSPYLRGWKDPLNVQLSACMHTNTYPHTDTHTPSHAWTSEEIFKAVPMCNTIRLLVMSWNAGVYVSRACLSSLMSQEKWMKGGRLASKLAIVLLIERGLRWNFFFVFLNMVGYWVWLWELLVFSVVIWHSQSLYKTALIQYRCIWSAIAALWPT